MAVGASQRFKATGTYSDSTTRDITGSVTWTSSSPATASVDASGKATAVAPGATTITASMGGIPGTATATVTPATVQSIAVTADSPTIAVGTSQQYTAVGTLSDSTTQDLTGSVTWNSSSPAAATIDANGTATGIAAGSTTITASFGGVSGTKNLTVTSGTLQSIAVTPADPTVAAGGTRQFTATGTFSDSTTQNLTASVTWTSSSPSVASIGSDGKAAALAAGSSTITASLGGKSGSTGITVTPAVATGTWTGTYTIYDDPLDPSQLGTYFFQLVLNQNGTSVTGTATLRTDTGGQKSGTGQLTGTVTGNQINLTFTYVTPFNPQGTDILTDIGTAVITDNTMTGSVIENYQSRYNCSYVFSLTKNP
jgi:uncharacterized protein YjdB